MPADGPSLREVARNRSALLFVAATFVLEVGISAQLTALGKRVFDVTGRELDLGLLGLAEFLPVVLLVLVAGAVSDRVDRRRVAAVALTVEAGFAVLLAVEVERAEPTLTRILALVLGYATARAFLSPAHRALPATIVAADALPRMNALYIGSFQGGIIAGPVIGALLYTVDVWVPFAASAACLVVSAALMLGVRIRPDAALADRPPPKSIRAGLSEAFEGLRVVRREPVLLGAISLDLFAVLFGGAKALLPAIAEERLHVGVVGLGWLQAAVGIGAGAMTLAMAVRPVTRRVGPVLFLVVGIFGVGSIVLGWTTSYAVAFLILLVLAGADSISVFIRSTLVPLVTPNAVRGRVGAVENVFIGASNELGMFESGLTGQWLGAGPAVMVGGALTIVVVVVWPFLFPAIWRLDRFPPAVDSIPPRDEALINAATSAATSRAEGS
jgi:MFS family permease